MSPAVLVTAYRPDPTRWTDDFLRRERMTKRRHTRLVREGTYAAEGEIELIDGEGGWAPYLSPADAGRLDEVREALRA
jgi:hypothetical protein